MPFVVRLPSRVLFRPFTQPRSGTIAELFDVNYFGRPVACCLLSLITRPSWYLFGESGGRRIDQGSRFC